MQNEFYPVSDAGLPVDLMVFLRESELALRWRMSERTLQRWRQAGEVPRHLRLGARVLYPIVDILAFEADRVSGDGEGVRP